MRMKYNICLSTAEEIKRCMFEAVNRFRSKAQKRIGKINLLLHIKHLAL